MDFISLSKTNRLFWLGRYYERVSLTLQYMMECYDVVIDTDNFDYATYCQKVGIPNNYSDMDDFFKRYIYDGKDPYSVRSAAEQMLGNGMVLRETIGSSTLAYLQMAVYTLDSEAEGDSVGIRLLQVLDNVMAFRGSYDDFIMEDTVRNTIKCGASVERLSYLLRTGYLEKTIPDELEKFLKRIPRSSLQASALPFQSLLRQSRLYGGKNPSDSLAKDDFLAAVENIFMV